MTQEVALVTGGGSGIGRATALNLARRGAMVGVLDYDLAAAQRTAAQIGNQQALALQADVSSSEEMQHAVAQLVEQTGRLDTVIANAGIEIPGRVDEIQEELWHRGLAVNVTGVFHTARHSLNHLKLSGRGAFVAVASDAGLRGAQGWPAYAATKHAVIGLIKSMALDHGPDGVRINAVCPGWVSTDLMARVIAPEKNQSMLDHVPLGRLALPEDVAEVIAHLTSPDSRHTHGMAYLMDGGEMAGSFREQRPASDDAA